jgi:hypothetical protein
MYYDMERHLAYPKLKHTRLNKTKMKGYAYELSDTMATT